ncbi:MAG: hypothetical protein KDK41_05830 [Leptospiraceae bacterium]|nr:hypothetical protein [Leptospiraceae bacterium]MCB1200146.1 hypothetical protein [Leptospiraceae bacterium]
MAENSDQGLNPEKNINGKRADVPPLLFLDPRPVRHTERIVDLMAILFQRKN